MQQSLQQKTQKQAEEVKSCLENRKDIEHNKQHVFKSHIKPENNNYISFVILNKRKTFEKLCGKMLKSIEQSGSQGCIYLC